MKDRISARDLKDFWYSNLRHQPLRPLLFNTLGRMPHHHQYLRNPAFQDSTSLHQSPQRRLQKFQLKCLAITILQSLWPSLNAHLDLYLPTQLPHEGCTLATSPRGTSRRTRSLLFQRKLPRLQAHKRLNPPKRRLFTLPLCLPLKMCCYRRLTLCSTQPKLRSRHPLMSLEDLESKRSKLGNFEVEDVGMNWTLKSAKMPIEKWTTLGD